MDTQFQAYKRQFEDTLIHLFEIDKPFLIDGVTVDTDINGMTKVYSRVGNLIAQRKNARNEIADLQEPDYSARHLFIKTDYVATPMDQEDVEKMVKNPQDDLYVEAVHAIYDAQTAAVMDAFFADVVINEDASGTASLPAGNVVAVNYSTGPFGQNSGAANVGLNIDKLLKVKSLISAAKIRVNTSEMNSLNIAICEDDLQALMANKIGTDNFPLIDRFNQLQSSFTKAADNLIDHKFQWQGFNFHVIPPQYFKLNGSGHRRLPVWTKDGVVFGIKQNVATEIVKLPQTVESTKIQALTRTGGMRKHESKVYEILAKV